MTRATPATRFAAGPSAVAPPPIRDGVRLLVARAGRPATHHRFRDLPRALAPGDLVVVNTSDTEPAALPGHREDGRAVRLHVSGPTRDASAYVVELRTPDGHRVLDGRAGERIALPAGVVTTLRGDGGRLWRAELPIGDGWLAAHGRPIRYSYLRSDHLRSDYLLGGPPIADHRTVFATPVPGEFASAEMPSAGRPFTARVLDDLVTRGVGVARIVLHTGVSSLEADELPLPERFRVPVAAADAVNATRARGGRVVAVGTTVTRALETVARDDDTMRAAGGWTDLVLGPDRAARIVDGLVTGWHEPEASHLLLLEAVAGAELVGRAYSAAVEREYLWHEFGDSCLLLPARTATRRAR